MIRRLLVLLIALCALPILAFADQFVLAHAGIRLTVPENGRVLMPENLDKQGELLTKLGVTAEGMAAAYRAEGVVAELYLAEGGQVSIAVLADEQAAALRSVSRMTEEERDTLRARFEAMPLYQDVAWEGTEYLTMHWSLESGGVAVTWLRAITVRHGALYVYTACAPGTDDVAALRTLLQTALDGIEYLGSIRGPAPELTPTATTAPAPTPSPTPGIAAQRGEATGYALSLEGLPSYADQTLLQVKGVTEPSARVRLLIDGRQHASGQANGRGLFEMDVTLPEVDGPHTISFEISRSGVNAVYHYTVELKQRTVPITVLSPQGDVIGPSFDLTIQTMPGASLHLTTPNGTLRARADASGLVNFTLNVRHEGEYEYRIEATQDGYRKGEYPLVIRRFLSPQELQSAFRSGIIEIPYRRLTDTTSYYQGRKVEYRGRIAAIGEVDGYPCLLVYTSNPGTGVWRDPVYVVCGDLLSFELEQVITVLATVRGDGYEYEGEMVPVLEGAYYFD